MLQVTVPRPTTPPECQPAEALPIYLSELVAALSYALDLTEGQPPGHSIRTCLIGMRLAETLGLSEDTRQDLYYALLLKDAGCSSNATRLAQIIGGDEIAAKRGVKTTDWTRVGFESLRYAWQYVLPGRPIAERLTRMMEIARSRVPQQREIVQIRCERGAQIARRMGFSEATATAIRSLDEHWNGGGYPDRLAGDNIPLLARILSISQTIEVHVSAHGIENARRVLRKRKGRWFDPALVNAAESLFRDALFWQRLPGEMAREEVLLQEPRSAGQPISGVRLDEICLAFADVIDAKSPFTYAHSQGVASAAVLIAKGLDLPEVDVQMIRRAALLHDIGKLSVPNAILEKPGKLDPQEWEMVRRHPYYSQRILEHVGGFAELSRVAGAHHEKLDGSGYWRGVSAAQLPLAARILTVADIYDALAAKRPYREALAPEQVLRIMGKDAPRALDAGCLDVLRQDKLSLSALAVAVGTSDSSAHERRPLRIETPVRDQALHRASVVAGA